MNLLSGNKWLKNMSDFMTFSDESAVEYAEVHLASTDTATELNGLVEKEILRTGYWPVIPTRGGIKKMPLTITRDGKSDKEKGIIALSEILENFEKVGQRVQIPLTDDDDDHKNQIRTNTGFVKSLFIRDNGDGDSRLVARMEFTEPDVKDKVLRGTFADVSCGIPWEFRSRGEDFGAVLEHVCITNRPFIDGLGDFLALSDGPDGPEREISHYTTPTAPTPQASPVPEAPPQVKVVDPFGGLSFKQILDQALTVLPEDMRETFTVIDVRANGVVVQNDDAKMALRIPFKIEDGRMVSTNEGWARLTYEGEATPLAEQKPAAPSQPVPEEDEENPPESAKPVKPESSQDPVDRDLEVARQVRQARLGAVAATSNPTKEANMPLTREELEQLNLSDMPESQRATLQKLLDENVTLSAQTREGQITERIHELEELGLRDKPGALKLYRQVALGDDGGPAVVVLSDDGKKESRTALSILDDFIAALKGEADKIVLSDQAQLVPDDKKPPLNPEGEKKPVAERLADAKAALSGVHGA